MSHIPITICLKTSKSTETTKHYVITHTEEAVENRELHSAFLDIEGASDSNSCDIAKPAKCHGLGDIMVMDWLHAGWKKNSATLAGELHRVCGQLLHAVE
jgi:hypothetical protein